MNGHRLIPNDCPVAAIWHKAGGVGCESTQEALEDENRRGIGVIVLAVVLW